jgi:hypothetical protein
MSEDAVRAALEGAIQDQFMSAYPAVKVEFENVPFKPPVNAAWIKVNVIDNDAHRANIGNMQEFKGCGVVNIQIQAPENTGSKAAKDIRQALFDVLADRQIALPGGGSVTTYGAEKRTRGVLNGWYALALVISYRYFFRRAA